MNRSLFTRSAFWLVLLTLLGGSHIAAQSKEPQTISVKLLPLKKDGQTLHCNWEAKNDGLVDVYIADNARSANGAYGPSLDLNLEEKTLWISYRLYSLPSTLLLAKNDSGIHVRILRAGQVFRGQLDVTLPTLETVPPYDNGLKQKQIEASSVHLMAMSVAVFPVNEDLVAILKSRPMEWLNGMERPSGYPVNGFHMLPLQTIVVSKAIRVPDAAF